VYFPKNRWLGQRFFFKVLFFFFHFYDYFYILNPIQMLDTPQQQEVFRQILDLNWEISHQETALQAQKNQLHSLKMKLQDLMGEENYNSFLELGQQMFKPKD
jgi:hypothetical protein